MRPSTLLLPATALLAASASAKINIHNPNAANLPGSLDLALAACTEHLHTAPPLSPQPHAVSESATAHAAAATQKQQPAAQPVINSTARKVIGGIAVAVLVGVI